MHRGKCRQFKQINQRKSRSKVDCIVSDMVANFTGDKMTDALRTMSLCEDAIMFAVGSTPSRTSKESGLLRDGGTFLCKYFACDQNKELMDVAKSEFRYVTIVKPPASRKESAELYLFATGYLSGNKTEI